DREVMVVGDACSAGFRVKPLRKWIAERIDTATRPGARLQHRNVVTCLSEFVGSRQASQSCADDEHTLRGPPSLQALLQLKCTWQGQRHGHSSHCCLLQEVSTLHGYRHKSGQDTPRPCPLAQ